MKTWSDSSGIRIVLIAGLIGASSACMAARVVNFPPPESRPPPPVKSPPRAQASGEETAILPGPGPTMRKTQERQPPPPTTLTVMFKLQYGAQLDYVYPDGRVQTFEQWESFKNDGYMLIKHVNERLADGNNYEYATKPLSSSGFDPVDIPLLYMTGDYDFVFTDQETDNLRKFLMDGGTIIFNAARGRDEFSAAVAREMRRVFPAKVFMKLSLDHPIYNTRYRIREVVAMVNGVRATQPPEIYSLDIGVRAAAILIPGGMGTAWSGGEYHPAGKHIVGESAVRIGVNLVSYILGNTQYGRFLAQKFPIYDGSTQSGDVLRFACARYAGSWDVNPGLQNSLLGGIHDNTGIDVAYMPNYVSLADADMGHYPVVFMTGHYDFVWSAEEIRNLRGYLLKGGTLIAGAAAGLRPFDTAFRRELKKVFPDSALVGLPPSHPIFISGWDVIDKVEYTPAALRDDPTLQHPRFYGLFIDNRPVVLYTPYDFQSGLNRESNAYAKGLTSNDALRLAVNMVTYVLSH